MSFYARYPSVQANNASVGVDGAPIPLSSTLIGGDNPSGNLAPVHVDAAGRLIVAVESAPALPDYAKETKQDTQITQETAIAGSVSAINTKTPALGTALIAASTPVNIASDQTVPVSAASLPLPAGAATAALQTSGNASLSSIDTKLTAPLSVTGPLTDTQLRASAVPVSMASSPLPTGAATAANQATEIASLASIDGKLNSLGQKASAASVPVVVASDQSAIPVSAASLPLPSGAATETTLSALNTKVPASLTVTSTRLLVDGSGVTQPVSAVSLPLPAGAATSALQTTLNAQIPTTLGQKTMANSLAVVLASDQSSIGTSQAGYTKSNTPSYNIYSSTSVTTAAYVQLVASTTSAVKQLQIFDSSGQAMIIATGAAASEVDQIYVPPGGGVFNLAIAAGIRVSIKALTATANTGYLLVDYLG